MDVRDKLLLRFFSDFENAPLAALHERQAAHHVADLRFDHEHDRIVSQPGVGSEKQEKVGKAAYRDAEISAHALAPCVVNFNALAAHEPDSDEGLCRAKARAEDKDVDGAFDTI